MAERYFDDFKIGERFSSGGVTLSESQILDFALQFDPQPFHIDKQAAAEGPFGELTASGFHTLALSFRIFYESKVFNACSLGSPGLDELRWLKPVRPGDTLSVEAEVIEMRPSASKPDLGILKMGYETKNQSGEAVMRFIAIHLFARRTTKGSIVP